MGDDRRGSTRLAVRTSQVEEGEEEELELSDYWDQVDDDDEDDSGGYYASDMECMDDDECDKSSSSDKTVTSKERRMPPPDSRYLRTVARPEELSDSEKVRIFDALMRAGGEKTLRAMRIFIQPNLDAILLETRILVDCQNGLRQYVDSHGWLRFSFSRVSALDHGILAAVGELWSSLDEKFRRCFTVAVWVTEGLGVEGQRELAVHLAYYARHKAAACDMGIDTDYCLCHYTGSDRWHRVEARYDKDSRIIQLYLAGWEALQRVCDARLLGIVSREPPIGGGNAVASAKGKGENAVLDYVAWDGSSVTSKERADKAINTRVKRARGVEGQQRVEEALNEGTLSVEEVMAMDDVAARDIYSKMGDRQAEQSRAIEDEKARGRTGKFRHRFKDGTIATLDTATGTQHSGGDRQAEQSRAIEDEKARGTTGKFQHRFLDGTIATLDTATGMQHSGGSSDKVDESGLGTRERKSLSHLVDPDERKNKAERDKFSDQVDLRVSNPGTSTLFVDTGPASDPKFKSFGAHPIRARSRGCTRIYLPAAYLKRVLIQSGFDPQAVLGAHKEWTVVQARLAGLIGDVIEVNGERLKWDGRDFR